MDAPGTILPNGGIVLAERPTVGRDDGETVVLALNPKEFLPFCVWRRHKTNGDDVTFSGDYFAADQLDKALRHYKTR